MNSLMSATSNHPTLIFLSAILKFRKLRWLTLKVYELLTFDTRPPKLNQNESETHVFMNETHQLLFIGISLFDVNSVKASLILGTWKHQRRFCLKLIVVLKRFQSVAGSILTGFDNSANSTLLGLDR